jgi:hypothetical protein
MGAHPVRDGHGVQDAEGEEQRAAEHKASEQNVADPVLALHLAIVLGRDVARDAGGEGIQHNHGRVHSATAVGVKHAHAGEGEDGRGEEEQLSAGANKRTKQTFLGREAEHIAVDVLPPRLLLLLCMRQHQITCITSRPVQLRFEWGQENVWSCQNQAPAIPASHLRPPGCI